MDLDPDVHSLTWIHGFIDTDPWIHESISKNSYTMDHKHKIKVQYPFPIFGGSLS